MTPVVVGRAAVEMLRRMGAAERVVVRDNITTIRHDPGRAGIPAGDDVIPPQVWRHTCPDSTFIVYYRWASSTEETSALAALLSSLHREGDPPLVTDGGSGIEIVDVARIVAL
jgi:hypothetical protein